MDIQTKVNGTYYNNRQYFIKYVKNNEDHSYMYLKREPNNKFDKNAVKVMAGVRGGKHVEVGYIPKELAPTIAKNMDSGKRPWVEAFDISGDQVYKYGVNIKINLK